MKKVFIVIGLCLILIILTYSFIINISDRVIVMEEEVYSTKSSILISEKRKYNTINGLIDSVSSHKYSESSIYDNIVRAKVILSSGDSDGALGVIIDISKEYPKVTENDNYRLLMAEVERNEKSLTRYRKDYNIKVREYNDFIGRSIIGGLLILSGYEPTTFDYIGKE